MALPPLRRAAHHFLWWLAAAMFCAVSTGTVPMRANAQSVTERVGPEAWMARLSSPDPVVRRGAVYSLGRFVPSDERVRERIRSRLDSLLQTERDPSVALAAVAALSRDGHPRAISVLRGYLPREARGALLPIPVRVAVVRAVAPTLTPPLVEELLRLPISESAEVFDAVARALAIQPDGVFGQMVSRPRRVTTSATVMILRAMAYRGDPRWGTVVMEQLRATSSMVVEAAIETAVQLRLVEAGPEIEELARTADDRGVRRAGLRALGTLGVPVDPEVIQAAIEEPATRQAALEACAQRGDRSLVPLVVPLLSAEWNADRRAAAEVLGTLGGPLAVQTLARQLARETAPDVRNALLHALAIAGGTEARRIVAQAAEQDDAGRWALVETALRGEAFEPPASLSVAVAHGRPGALVLAGLAGGYEHALIRALESDDANVRVSAAIGLGLARATNAEAALERRLFREDDEGVRAAITMALASTGGRIAREALVSLLVREADAPSTAAVVAVEAAGRQGLREAVPAIRKMTVHPRAIVRAVAARALGRLRDPTSRGVLERMGRFDPDAEARGVALLALAEVAGPDALDTIRMTQSIAWTARLEDLAARAEQVARGVRAVATVTGASVARVSGVPPRSVWMLSLADGGSLFGVASGDGQVVVAGAPAEHVPLIRLDTP